MKNKALLGTLAVLFLGFAVPAQADCPLPKAPATIPDGKTADEAEMLAAMNAFKAYNEEVQAFQACLDEASNGQTMHYKSMQAKKLAAVVAELENKAKKFNEQVRIFKARTS